MPDLFILGATKCATTSMYNQMMKHSDVSHTKRKEPHYHFSKVLGYNFEGPADNDSIAQMFVTDEHEYDNLYEPNKLKIDGSAMSIEDPRIVEDMNKDYPRAKFIIMLRSPVERAFSAYSHLIRDARETRTFREALDHEIKGERVNFMPIWHNIKSSRYVDSVQHARELLGDRLMVVDFLDYVKKNSEVMDKVSQFIGIDPIEWQKDVANRSGVPRSKTFQKVLMRKSIFKTIFVKLFPQKMVTSLKRQLMERNTGSKQILSQDDREYFKSLVSDEKDKIKQGTPDTELLMRLYS